MNIKTVIQIFIFLIIVISLYLFIKITFLSENQEIMGEFAECLEGVKEACNFLNYPVVSGNVSFYNGTNKKNILPTPVIGGVGLISRLNGKINHQFKKENSQIILIGKIG